MRTSTLKGMGAAPPRRGDSKGTSRRPHQRGWRRRLLTARGAASPSGWGPRRSDLRATSPRRSRSRRAGREPPAPAKAALSEVCEPPRNDFGRLETNKTSKEDDSGEGVEKRFAVVYGQTLPTRPRLHAEPLPPPGPWAASVCRTHLPRVTGFPRGPERREGRGSRWAGVDVWAASARGHTARGPREGREGAAGAGQSREEPGRTASHAGGLAVLPGSLRPGGSEPGGVYCRVMPLLMPPGASPHLGLVGTGEARASRPGGPVLQPSTQECASR